MQMSNGFFLRRKVVLIEISKLLEAYEEKIKKLFLELQPHPYDIYYMRLEFLLIKFKTYLGLSRMSEFLITKKQWIEWHETEVSNTLNEVIDFIIEIQ